MSTRERKKAKNKERILIYLEKFINEHGYSPSVRDIAAAVGFSSTSTVHSYLTQMQADGYINYADGKRRAITINYENVPRNISESFTNSDSSANKSTNPSPKASDKDQNTTSWPLVGLVTAGTPILATENIEYNISIDNKLFPYSNEESFLLRVRGNSMLNIGINDGDLIVVRPGHSAEINDIIVALIGDEATVKRFSYLDGEPYLFPENENYSPIPFNTEDCLVIGKVVGLIRTRI